MLTQPAAPPLPPNPPPQAPPAAPAEDDSQPQQPAQSAKPASSLILTPEREQWLTKLCVDFLKDTERQIGRNARGETEVGSPLYRRKCNMETHADDLKWRAAEYGGVFAEQFNFTRGKSKQIQRRMSAKLTDDLLGTTPFWAAFPERAGDPELVKNIEAYVQEKIEQAGIPQILREAISAALVRDEVILHFWYDTDISKYVGPATVAVDPATGEPIKTPVKGFFIYQNDDMVPNPAVAGEMILKKDPSFTTSTQLQYQSFDALAQEQVIWDGLRAVLLDNRDFICPYNVPTIHAAKFYARRYDREWAQMKAQYAGFDTAESYFSQHPESAASNVGKDSYNQSESDLIKYVHVAECYIRCDADQDGSEEEILFVLDVENQKPVFYDYLYKHLKKRPNEVIVGLRKVANSWAGVGVYSETKHANTFIDLTFNRVIKKDSQNGSVTGINPKACKEWATGDNGFKVGGPEYVHWNQGFGTPENPGVYRIQLTEVSAESMDLSNGASQDLEVTFGVSTTASGSANKLDRSTTATGNALMEKEGDQIVKEAMKGEGEGIIACLEQCVDIVLENMDPTEIYLTKEAQLITLNRDEIRGLEKQVRLVLTKSRSAEGAALSQQAMNVMFAYMEKPPAERRAVRDFVVSILKSLEVVDAEEKVPQVTDQDIAAYAAQTAQQPPANASVSAKLSDFAPSERAAIVQRDYDIQPATEDELAQHVAQQTAAKVTEKVASQPPPTPPAKP